EDAPRVRSGGGRIRAVDPEAQVPHAALVGHEIGGRDFEPTFETAEDAPVEALAEGGAGSDRPVDLHLDHQTVGRSVEREAVGENAEAAGAVEGEGRVVGLLRVDQGPGRASPAHPPQDVADQGPPEPAPPGGGMDSEPLYVAGARPPPADDVAVEAVAPAV